MVVEIVHSVCVTVWARSHLAPSSTYCFIESPRHCTKPLLFPCWNCIPDELKAPQTRLFGKLSSTIENLFECVLLGRERITEVQKCIVPRVKLGDFRFEFKYEMEYENDFLVLVCRLHIIKSHTHFIPWATLYTYIHIKSEGFRNVNGSKIVLELNVVLVVQSEGP